MVCNEWPCYIWTGQRGFTNVFSRIQCGSFKTKHIGNDCLWAGQNVHVQVMIALHLIFSIYSPIFLCIWCWICILFSIITGNALSFYPIFFCNHVKMINNFWQIMKDHHGLLLEFTVGTWSHTILHRNYFDNYGLWLGIDISMWDFTRWDLCQLPLWKYGRIEQVVKCVDQCVNVIPT